MVIHGNERYSEMRQEEFLCQSGRIPVVNSYTYLGLEMDWTFRNTTMQLERARQGRIVLDSLSPFLGNARVPLHIKSVVIKQLLIPVLSYGAEVWATKLSEFGYLSKVLVEAVNLAMCYNKQNRSMCTETMLQELDIPPLSAVLYSKRMRAWAKWRHSRTWIADFVRARSTTRGTWSQGCGTQCSRLLTQLHQANRDASSYDFEDVSSKRLARVIKEFLTTKHHAAKTLTTASMRSYQVFGMAGSNGFIRHSALCNEVFNVNLLARARGNGFGNLWYRAKHVVATHVARLDVRDPLLHVCPSCHGCFSDTLDHVVLGCEKYTVERQAFIWYELKCVLDFMAEHGVDHSRENVWHCVLGGFPQGVKTADGRDVSRLFYDFWLKTNLNRGTVYQTLCRWLEFVLPEHFRAIRHFVEAHTKRVGSSLSLHQQYERRNRVLAPEVDANRYGSSSTWGVTGI